VADLGFLKGGFLNRCAQSPPKISAWPRPL